MPVKKLATWAFRGVAKRIPEEVPLIIESVVAEADIERELRAVRAAFSESASAPQLRVRSAAHA